MPLSAMATPEIGQRSGKKARLERRARNKNQEETNIAPGLDEDFDDNNYNTNKGHTGKKFAVEEDKNKNTLCSNIFLKF